VGWGRGRYLGIVRDLAPWFLQRAVISWGAAVVLSMLFTSSPNNPLTQWIPGVVTMLWWLGGVVLVVGLVLVGLGITGERIDGE
jgi:hypothetical protein